MGTDLKPDDLVVIDDVIWGEYKTFYQRVGSIKRLFSIPAGGAEPETLCVIVQKLEDNLSLTTEAKYVRQLTKKEKVEVLLMRGII
ncbi:hypothetical protein [Marinobacterium litorale]|uniref:hypothetical protein n=1 Tax=Marinobacterium litorale TaxID=404770 RepID=UPI000482DD4B|nr:hypothetical protein [Marinobacterium litorale]